MAGWHTRLWRRVKIAPWITINVSKSGPSVSLGPRGAKVTLGRRGVRQTLGIPGTGIFATRQLGARDRTHATPSDSEDVAATASETAATSAEAGNAPTTSGAGSDAQAQAPTTAATEPAYGLAIVAGVVFGIALAIIGLPTAQVFLGGGTAVVAGIVYEGLAHHHPGPAKLVIQLLVGLATVIAGLIGLVALAVLTGVLGGLSASARPHRRRRRGGW